MKNLVRFCTVGREVLRVAQDDSAGRSRDDAGVMMKILVLGSNGQLGRSFSAVSAEFNEFEFYFAGRELDISQPGLVADFLANNPFDVVINCAAYTAVDKAESEPELADLVNHVAVRNLAELVKRQGAFLIHFSTDYVFDGRRQEPYLEADQTCPLNVYGQSKLNGEQALFVVNPPGLVVRSSWLFSPFGHNFLNTMLRLGRTQKQVRVVADQVGSPTSALDLARAVLEILRFRQQVLRVKPNHQVWCSMQLVHFANQGEASWAGFAEEIMHVRGLDCEVEPITSADYGAPAKRPTYSVLDTAKIQAWLPQPIRCWRDALVEVACHSEAKPKNL